MEEYRIRIAYFLILSFSIVLLSSQGTSSSYLNKSWADEPLTLDNEQDIKIQDNSDTDTDTDNRIKRYQPYLVKIPKTIIKR